MSQPPDDRTARASIRIAAPAPEVYDVVADVARMGELSPEATGTVGSPGPLQVGDKFWGTNKRGLWRWATRCTVLAADRGRRFEFDVDFGPMPISRWVYEFEPTDDGCEVTETWHDRRVGGPVKWAGSMIIPGPRAEHNQAGIEQTLQQLKRTVEESWR